MGKGSGDAACLQETYLQQFLHPLCSLCGSIVQSLIFLLCAMEPAPKRTRVAFEQPSFYFQCTTPKPDGNLWPPNLLRLVNNGDKNEVCCDNSPPHGNWVLTPNMLIITFHFSGGPNVKTLLFRRIEGTEAWLQTNSGPPWQGVLIPHPGGALQQMYSTKGSKGIMCSIGFGRVHNHWFGECAGTRRTGPSAVPAYLYIYNYRTGSSVELKLIRT